MSRDIYPKGSIDNFHLSEAGQQAQQAEAGGGKHREPQCALPRVAVEEATGAEQRGIDEGAAQRPAQQRARHVVGRG